MEKQIIINAIGTLTGALDAMTRAKNDEGAKVVSAKILELIKQL